VIDNLDDLRIFTRIVARGSLSGAARELHLSLAVVSKRLAALEARLGVRLLNRTTRRLNPTVEGADFCERAVRILADLDDAVDALSASRQAVRGLLRVSATFNFGRRYVAPALFEFRKLHPELEVDLQLTDIAVDLVETGTDLAIRIGSLDDSSLVARRLVESRRIVVASPEYLAAHGTPAHPLDLPNHDCLLSAKTGANWTFRRGGESITVHVGGGLRCNVGDTAIAWALAGGGIMRKSIWDVADELSAGRLCQVLPEWDISEAPIHAVYLSNRNTPPKVRRFIDFLAERLREAPEADHFGWLRSRAPRAA